MTIHPETDESNILRLSHLCENFYDFPTSIQQDYLTKVFDFLYSDWDFHGFPNPEILTVLAQIVTHDSFSHCSLNLNPRYDHLILIIETETFTPMVRPALAILSAIALYTSSLHTDSDFQTSVSILISRHPSFNFVPLCKAFILSQPFPSSQFLDCLYHYIEPILHTPNSLSFPDAVHFATVALRNEIPFDFSFFPSQIPDLLLTGNLTVVEAVIEFLCTSESCTEQICDILLDRLSELMIKRIVVRIVHLFLVAQKFLMERSEQIIHFLFEIVKDSDCPVRTVAMSCLLVFLGDVEFSVDLCELFLKFYDLPIASVRIFAIFVHWLQASNDSNLMTFVEMISERKEEITDFLDSSVLPEHLLFAAYLSFLGNGVT
jgi:hypothetical protein